MKSLVVIYLIGTSEGNDQAQHRSKQPVCESIVINDSNPDMANGFHRQSTHHPDGIVGEDFGAQDRSSNKPDAIPTEDGGFQDPFNEDVRRSTRTYMTSTRL